MSHKNRQTKNTTIELRWLRQGVMEEFSETGIEEVPINWNRFVDRSLSINPYGDVILDKQLKRGNIVLRINRNGKMEWYYVPLLRSGRKLTKTIKIDSTALQEEALRIVLSEVYDKERGIIHKTEFPNTKNIALMYTSALFDRKDTTE